VIFGAVTLVFMILYWLPGDPATLLVGEDAPAETIAQVRAQLGTDRPLLEQYVSYVGHLAKGDLGTSYATGEQVVSRLAAQVPATLGLTLFATLVAVLIGIGLGVVAAVHRGSWIDHAIQTSTLTFTSMPSFWLGILLILVFSVHFQWLPSIGNGTWSQLMLPAACMGLVTSGKLTRMVRNNVIDVLDEPFVTTLRGKGLLEHAVLYQHVLRSALIPTITLLGVLVGELLSGTVVVETLFARQGVGRIIAESVSIKDIPMIQGAVLFAAAFYVLINLLVDLSYGWIDRRVRY
jgi:peptide/nickel transport system permease protein